MEKLFWFDEGWDRGNFVWIQLLLAPSPLSLLHRRATGRFIVEKQWACLPATS